MIIYYIFWLRLDNNQSYF